MRIALLPDEYLPEGTRAHTKMFHDLAQELIKRGHYPVVITPGKPKQSSRLIVDFIDGVEVWFFRTGQLRGRGKIRRAINETLLSLNAWLATRERVISDNFDGVINYSPTIFFGALVYLIKKHCQCPSYLVLRDMFPQWAIDLGMIKEKSLVSSYFRFFEKFNYQQSDCIGVMSHANLATFVRLFPQYENVKVLPNWTEDGGTNPDQGASELRVKYGLEKKVIFFYGGNIGHAQDMDNLLRLAQNMRQYEEAHFLFVGQGDEVDLVKSRKREWNLANLTYLPSVSQAEYVKILCQADVGLFSLANSHTAHNFPGKILGYMAESIAILGSVNSGNDLIDFVNGGGGGGKVSVNGEDDALCKAAIELLLKPDFRKLCGASANRLLQEHFSVESAANSILGELEQQNVGEKG